jgi:hypothetical protein
LSSPEYNLTIEDPILTIQGVSPTQVQINALAYVTRLGNLQMFQYLHEHCGASLKGVRAVYAQVFKTPMDIVCEHGFYELLKYYLPKYLADTEPLDSLNSSDEHSLSLQSKDQSLPHASVASSTQLAVHRACEKSHMDIVRYLHEYFTNKKPPLELDLHSEDEGSGENSVLIACRIGSIKLLRYLYCEVGVSIHTLNKRKENAVQVAVAAAKKADAGRYYEIIRFLVEDAEIDVTYNYEETLMMVFDTRILSYLETQLLKVGVTAVRKQQLDDEYSLSKRRPAEKLNTSLNTGSRFNIAEIFKEELFSESYLSSITYKSLTPDMSVIPQ